MAENGRCPASEDRKTRSERFLQERRRRARRRRRVLIGAGVIAALACTVAGLWFGYRIIAGEERPERPTYRLVVPEGLTVRQTALRAEVATEGSVTTGEFMDAASTGDYRYPFLEGSGGNLEGFLFPKTYDVNHGATARSVIQKMLRQFESETARLDWGRARELGVNRYQAVIIASLIEKEVRVPEERPLVASVIYNRLKSDMRLEIDATVQYALGEWKPALTNEDLKIDSPYNTYRVKGLPPAPICSPGFESLRAALYPDRTDYLYYILTDPAAGRHSFTADYQEFLRWKQHSGSRP